MTRLLHDALALTPNRHLGTRPSALGEGVVRGGLLPSARSEVPGTEVASGMWGFQG